ncbi:MAG: hypothetical protein K6T62_05420, partial [Alicyclobacillus sp.]|nr:hypothetical protein [Alicyclobacillus sp.]
KTAYVVIHSGDGGRTWREVDADTAPDRATELLFLDVGDAQHAWWLCALPKTAFQPEPDRIIGGPKADAVTMNRVMGTYVVRLSMDGGATVSQIQLPWPSSRCIVTDLMFSDARHGSITLVDQQTATKTAYKTADGGATWTLVH